MKFHTYCFSIFFLASTVLIASTKTPEDYDERLKKTPNVQKVITLNESIESSKISYEYSNSLVRDDESDSTEDGNNMWPPADLSSVILKINIARVNRERQRPKSAPAKL